MDFRCTDLGKISVIFCPFQNVVGLIKLSGANLQPQQETSKPSLAEVS